MKASSKKTAKLSSRSNGKLKTAGGKQTVKRAAKKSNKKRRVIKSTVPPQFRAMKRLAATKDPRFWTLRRELRDYLYSLPEEEVEPFLDGLGEPYLGYLFIELSQESFRKNPISVWGTDYSEYFKAE